MELQRNPPPNTDPGLRIFTIRGIPQQIEVARHLIDEKVGVRTRPFPTWLTSSWVSFGCPRYLFFPRALYLLCLPVLIPHEGDPLPLCQGGRSGPRDTRPRPRRDEGSPLAELSTATAAQAPEASPLQA